MNNSHALNANDTGMTLLHFAAMRGDKERVQALLAKGANPNLLNNAGEPPLFAVLRLSMMAGPEVIPEREAIFNVLWDVTAPEIRTGQDKQGATVLHLMAANGFDGLMCEVLEKEPGLAAKHKLYNAREYPIHTAIINGDLAAAKTLFDLDPATPTYMNSTEQLPLHLAAQSSNKEMLEFCCAKHIDEIDKPDRDGRTPLGLLRGRMDLTEQEQKDYEVCLLAQGAQQEQINSRRTSRVEF
ncbi:MAG: ankyrin repeat domain-containing protein [Legionellaceae bacterium]|nr:ankyrin repeat domain-containing protein [Legionellaceae bacterium]